MLEEHALHILVFESLHKLEKTWTGSCLTLHKPIFINALWLGIVLTQENRDEYI